MLCTRTANAEQLLSTMWQGVQVATERRMGAADSKTRAQLLDAAERVLIEEGYAAVTSRRVAAKADLKPQLVHYYFRTMDDLFIELFQRNADASLARAEKVLAANPSLKDLWELNGDPRGAKFLIEFAALANHRKPIRAEIAKYAKRNRAMQLAALSKALAGAGVVDAQVPAVAALLLMTGLGQIVGIEKALGMNDGHKETLAFIEAAVAMLDARTG